VIEAATALALLVLGGLAGLAAVALHASWWGLLLAAVASLAVLVVLPPRWWTLPPYAVGWWVPLLVAWAGRSEGDYAVESSGYGYGLVVLATVVVVVAAFLTALRAPRRPPRPAPGSARRGAR
jgi:NADH:ubiquinone oxidoreductase subunit 4 (subunit M)